MSVDRDLARRVLDLPMQTNDANATTVRGYLVALLHALWHEGEGFSGKRPFGNSSWEHDLYQPLGAAGLIGVTLDEDGFIDTLPDSERAKADRLVDAAIDELGATP